MIFIFWVSESIKIIGRSKLSFILSLISTSISVILIIASITSFKISDELKSRLTKTVTINVFLKESISGESLQSLQDSLKTNDAFSRVVYIDKKTAAEIFIKQTGEDFRKILDYNPLPASFSLTINENFMSADSLNLLISKLKNIPEIDEVVYEQEFISAIINFLDTFKKYLLVITTLLILISLYIVYSTVKLIINSKYNELETMKLVGAKLSTIKLPIVFNGLITGLLSGLLAATFYYLIVMYAGSIPGLERYLRMNYWFYLIIVLCTGPLLNLIVSVIALRKISLKI